MSQRTATAVLEMVGKADCISCSNMERKRELRVMTCGHFYCTECIYRMCRLALGDRSLIPLRCCRKEIPIDYIREALPTTQDYRLYEKFLREKNWKQSNLVSDSEYARVVLCIGGKQCPGCGIGVQRDHGCIHMKCPNGHEFCFTCLRVWQTCCCQLIPEPELRHILGE
uniref:RING-type domain-containing protein n=1 Tax=Globisporangium ultimum (strain ATCC 200006 / CBS 805.95 / DAOM BR144) TaxID=431595 RepID=K3X161_GLOUD